MSDSYEIVRADGTRRRVCGYKFAAPKSGVKMYASTRLGQRKLPPSVDLRHFLTDIEDQGNTNSCVANAVAGAYEYLAKRHLGEDAYNVSRLFIYFNARMAQESEAEDNGSFICDAIEGLREHGACSEETWPFEESSVTDEPSDDAYDEAARFLVESSELVPVDLDAWRHCLAEGYPIIFGIALFNSFDQQRKKGLVPMPLQSESSRGDHGNHAMLCVGYSDTDKLFIVRNSWGNGWGDDGYCYIPYSYMVNPDFNLGDCWIIKQLDNFELDAETWGDEESIVEDFETELANMSDDEYYEMLEAMGDFPLEYRIGLILLHAAGADEEISEEEYDAISEYMSGTLEQLGVEMSSKKLLKNCWNSIDDEELLEESIALLGEYLSREMLAKIVSDAEQVIGTDDLSEDEEAFLFSLVSAWQIEEDGAEDDQDEGAEEEEEEDEDWDEDEDEDGEDYRAR
jgi:C1A family cysteine protease